jgi:type IV secretory pathway TraG/TraD family ATPase VirD4
MKFADHHVTLGTAAFRNRTHDVILKSADRLRHTYMIGKTGTGKSTLFQNMMLQDIQAGAGCCFVDPHGEAIDYLLENIPEHRFEDVILFDPSDTAWPMGLNLLEYKTAEEKDFLVAEAIQIFTKLFDPNSQGIVGPQFEHWMRNAALTVMADPAGGTLIEIPRLFTDREFEKHKRQFVRDKIVSAFWEQQMASTSQFHRSEMLNYFTSKFGRFMTNSLMRNIIGQTHSSFSLAEAMNSGKIVLINLSKGKVGEINAQMLGLILMTKLQVAAMQRAHLAPEERRPFYLFVDEFQNVLTDAFISMLAEARKYGLAVHLTNQYIAQLPDAMREAVLGNAATLLAFQVGAADVEALLAEFEARSPQDKQQLKPEDFQYLPRHHYFIRLLLDGVTHPAFLGRSLPPLSLNSPVIADQIRAFSRLSFAKPQALVERWQQPVVV